MDPKAKKIASLDWQEDGTPVSTLFDDPYFSVSGGLAETRHVFLAGNGLPERFCDGFHIAELGFGTGLNFLATWLAWNASGTPGTLNFTSFEAYPLSEADMVRASRQWPELEPLAKLLQRNLSPSGKMTLPGVRLEIVLGDARKTLPAWQDKADAWFLDGFSPSKNPEMWGEALMAAVGKHTTTNGTFATYTAAGHVRRALGSAGFSVSRVSGFARKRHMSIGRMLD